MEEEEESIRQERIAKEQKNKEAEDTKTIIRGTVEIASYLILGKLPKDK